MNYPPAVDLFSQSHLSVKGLNHMSVFYQFFTECCSDKGQATKYPFSLICRGKKGRKKKTAFKTYGADCVEPTWSLLQAWSPPGGDSPGRLRVDSGLTSLAQPQLFSWRPRLLPFCPSRRASQRSAPLARNPHQVALSHLPPHSLLQLQRRLCLWFACALATEQ